MRLRSQLSQVARTLTEARRSLCILHALELGPERRPGRARLAWPSRGLLLGVGAPEPLADRQRHLAETAAKGHAISLDDWLELTDAVLASSRQLCAEDTLMVLHAMVQHRAEDPSVSAALAVRISALAPTLSVSQTLEAMRLLGEHRWRDVARGARRHRAADAAIAELEQRLHHCATLDAHALSHTLAALAENGSCSQTLLQRLAAAALELRDLSYHHLVSAELAFKSLGGLQGPLAELLKHRRALFLDEAPAPTLLRALQAEDANLLPLWLLRSEDAEAALLSAFVKRLEGLGDEGAQNFEDPFDCFDLLTSRCRLPSAFLVSLCIWTRRCLRKGAQPKRALTTLRLVALDDACETRGIASAARESLDMAIRNYVVHQRFQ